MKSPLLLFLLAALLVIVQASNKVYVSNLNPFTTEDTLRELFGEYGYVLEAKLTRDSDGRSRGFGFVTYADDRQAQAAIDRLNDYWLDGRTIKVVDAASQGLSKTGLNDQEVMVGKGRFDHDRNDDSKQPEVVVEVLRTRNGGSVLVVL